MRIFVLGYYGYKNTGDDAIAEGVGTELAYRGFDFSIHHSNDPNITISRHFRKADVVVIPGGTHLRNWGKGWLWQSSRMLLFGCLCRLLGKKFYMCNVGIDGSFWEWAARRIANKVTIRDRETFDSAALMNFDLSGVERKKIIGVNLTPVNRIYYGNGQQDWRIATMIYLAISTWLEKHPDWTARCISFNGNSNYSDDYLNRAVAGALDGDFVPWYSNLNLTLTEIAECSVMIGMRYHACVFTALAGIPLLSIESYPSVRDFSWKWYPTRAISQVRVTNGIEFGKIFEEFMSSLDKQQPHIILDQMRELARKGVEL